MAEKFWVFQHICAWDIVPRPVGVQPISYK